MSASMRPTRCPRRDRAMARLTATVVLPTPPLPEPIATILETPGSATGEGMAAEWAIVFCCSFGRHLWFIEGIIEQPAEKVPLILEACARRIKGKAEAHPSLSRPFKDLTYLGGCWMA